MRRFSRSVVIGSAAVVFFLCLTVVGTAQERWHWPDHPENLQVLPKDTNSEQLRMTMGMFVRGLGVRCTFCHVGEEGKPLSTYDFPSDDNPNKNRAREMLRMVHSINDRLQTIDFGDAPQLTVSCATCHRGRSLPTTIREELRLAYADGGAAAALAHFEELRDRYQVRGTLDFGEGSLNGFGYELMSKDDVDGAIAVLRRNAELFPDSGNVWDSLAEAYLKADKPVQSAIYYRKSLEITPDNQNALEQLKKMGAVVGGEE